MDSEGMPLCNLRMPEDAWEKSYNELFDYIEEFFIHMKCESLMFDDDEYHFWINKLDPEGCAYDNDQQLRIDRSNFFYIYLTVTNGYDELEVHLYMPDVTSAYALYVYENIRRIGLKTIQLIKYCNFITEGFRPSRACYSA